MHGLNLVLSRQSHLFVLRALYHAEEPLTGREVERRTGLSNRSTMQALDGLVDLSILRKETGANAYYYELNENNYLVAKALKQAFDAEDAFWIDLGKVVRRTLHPKPIAAVATGPLARDESESSGRLELTMVFSSGRDRIRAFSKAERLSDVIWDRYALDIDPVLLDVNNMNQESHDALWRRVEREGILLFGSLP